LKGKKPKKPITTPSGDSLRQNMAALGSSHTKLREQALKAGQHDMPCSKCSETIPAHLINSISVCEFGKDECPFVIRYNKLLAADPDRAGLEIPGTSYSIKKPRS
jgi:hypothetical protein